MGRLYERPIIRKGTGSYSDTPYSDKNASEKAQLTLTLNLTVTLTLSLTLTPGTLLYNGTGNSAHYRLAYADFRSGACTVAPCGGE